MTALHPIDDDLPRRNRRVLAERQGWPDGALDACLELEQAYPRWAVLWTKGGLPRDPDRGYRAYATVERVLYDVFAETAEVLRERLADADLGLPPEREWPARLTPLR